MAYLDTLRVALAGPLTELTDYNQFILFKQEFNSSLGKYDKVPVSRSGLPASPVAPANWMCANDALQLCGTRNAAAGCDLYGVGFVLTKDDDLFCLDIDNGLTPDGEEKAQTTAICDWLPGAAVEVSINGHGYHVWGRGALPANHGTQYANEEQGIKFELFSHSRFIALSGKHARGNAALEQPAIMELQKAMFRAVSQDEDALSGNGPVEEWSGPADDTELLELMYRLEPPQDAAQLTRDGKPDVNFGDIVQLNADVLNRRYPAPNMRADGLGCDMSSVDHALARKLAYYTGKDAARMERLMRRMPWASMRDSKWATRSYMNKTLMRAATSVHAVFGANSVPDAATAQRGRELLSGALAQNASPAAIGGALLIGEDGLDAEPDGWLIDGVLPTTGLGTIVGAPGSGKTFIAMDIAMTLSQAHTAQWFGHDVEKTVPVTHVVLEDANGVVQRLKAWRQHHKRGINRKFARYHAPLNLFTGQDAGLTPLIAALTGAELTHGVIIIDTFACATAGMEENSAKDMGVVMASARALADATHSLVLLVHHTNKVDGTLRGSTALEGAMDVIIKVVKSEGQDGSIVREWKLEKSKQGPIGARSTFNLPQVKIGTTNKGKAVTSCVVQHTGIEVVEKAKKPEKERKSPRKEWEGAEAPNGPDKQNAYRRIVELLSGPNVDVHRNRDHPCISYQTVREALKIEFLAAANPSSVIGRALESLKADGWIKQFGGDRIEDQYYFAVRVKHPDGLHGMALNSA